jgi:hypothetical protein
MQFKLSILTTENTKPENNTLYNKNLLQTKQAILKAYQNHFRPIVPFLLLPYSIPPVITRKFYTTDSVTP